MGLLGICEGENSIEIRANPWLEGTSSSSWETFRLNLQR